MRRTERGATRGATGGATPKRNSLGKIASNLLKSQGATCCATDRNRAQRSTPLPIGGAAALLLRLEKRNETRGESGFAGRPS
jgi:hypothetical protein